MSRPNNRFSSLKFAHCRSCNAFNGIFRTLYCIEWVIRAINLLLIFQASDEEDGVGAVTIVSQKHVGVAQHRQGFFGHLTFCKWKILFVC